MSCSQGSSHRPRAQFKGVFIRSRPDLHKFKSSKLSSYSALVDNFVEPKAASVSTSENIPVEEETVAFTISEDINPAESTASQSLGNPQHKRRSIDEVRDIAPKLPRKRVKESHEGYLSVETENSGRLMKERRSHQRTSSSLTALRQNRTSGQAAPPKIGSSKEISRNKHKSSHSTLKKGRRTLSDSSEISDDVDDLTLSDYSEPEQKLREKKNEARSKFAKLRKARKATSQARMQKKELLSRRIVPDSDVDESSADSSSEDEYSEDESMGSSSVTDKEEMARREKEFIVDDLANKKNAARIKKQLEQHIPTKFKLVAHDNMAHFKVVCKFLVLSIFLPHRNWLNASAEYRESFNRIGKVIHSKMSLINSAAWIPAFKRTLERRRFFSKVILNPQSAGCDACKNRVKQSSFIVILKGKKYDPETLEILSSDSSSEDGYKSNASSSQTPNFRSRHKSNEFRFKCGLDCANKAAEFHYCHHWHHYLRRSLLSEVNDHNKGPKPLKESDGKPSKEEVRMLKKHVDELFDLLDKKERIQRLYNQMMSRLQQITKDWATA
ncbi:hypothetical protein CROQUDRAFT_262949 [Cronartium quercuum f. sp. fusiforme G11]|uniref:DUF4211 domain-containing protein n=1 Tax=Cronartium quercuum f. sp. fusiforme G11 TaxID=708437 RepID=A0A9P6NUW0_9BASI|nr:hypothetical protein CROQUDRAFT_262949 [Cronartium quercuum f. sp. fusiforme G11]